MTSSAQLATYPQNVQDFVNAMHRAPGGTGRGMAERVFGQVSGARHGSILTDIQLATYLLDNDWTFSDVAKRES